MKKSRVDKIVDNDQTGEHTNFQLDTMLHHEVMGMRVFNPKNIQPNPKKFQPNPKKFSSNIFFGCFRIFFGSRSPLALARDLSVIGT